MASPSLPGIRSARERILSTAFELFYREGIRSVGVDRVVEAAQVTRATFYRHFPSKDDLIVAYLEAQDRRIREAWLTLSGVPAGERLDQAGRSLVAEACTPGARGCPFINAAAEFADPGHPARQAVHRHRSWFRGALQELAAGAGLERPAQAADLLMLVRDGLMVGGYLDDPTSVANAWSEAVRRIVAGDRDDR